MTTSDIRSLTTQKSGTGAPSVSLTSIAAPKGSPLHQAYSSWARRIPMYSKVGVPRRFIQPVVRFDLTRIQQGGRPMSDAEVLDLIRASSGRKSLLTPHPSGFFSSVINDAGGILEGLTGVATHPGRLLDQFKAATELLPTATHELFGWKTPEIPGVWGSGDPSTRRMVEKSFDLAGSKIAHGDVGGGVSQVLTTPGMTLIPGTYTAAAIARGDWQELEHHPVSHFLDVLPYASLAGKAATSAAEAGRLGGAAQEAVRVEGGALEALRAGQPVKAIFRASLGHVPFPLSEAGNLELAKAIDAGTVPRVFPRSSEMVRAAIERLPLGGGGGLVQDISRWSAVGGRKYKLAVENMWKQFDEAVNKAVKSSAERELVYKKLTTDDPAINLPEHLQTIVDTLRENQRVIQNQLVAEGRLIPYTLSNGKVVYYSAKSFMGRQIIRTTAAYDRLVAARAAEANVAPAQGTLFPTEPSSPKVTRAEDVFAKESDRLEKFAQRYVPQEYKHLVQGRVLERLVEEAHTRMNTGEINQSQFDDIMASIHVRDLARATENIGGRALFERFVREESKNWQRWAVEYGRNPTYVPHASENSILSIVHATPIADRPASARTLQQYNIYRMEPGVSDLAAVYTYQASDLLRESSTFEHLKIVSDTYGVREETVRQIEQAKIAQGARGSVGDRVRRNWVPFSDVAGRYAGGYRKFDAAFPSDSDIMIPRIVANAIDSNMRIFGRGSFGMFDKATNLFRFAVTTSPRHVAHVLFSGMAFALGDQGPGVFWRIPGALKLLREGDFPIELRTSYFGGMTSDEITASINNQVMTHSWLRSVKRPFVGLKHFEERLSNMWKGASFLTEEKRALIRGLSPEDARMVGIKAALKTHMDVDGMVPFERSIVSRIFPFYPFTRQIIRYALRWPADHPWRAAVLSSITRNELADRATGLPMLFENYLPLGQMDANGNLPVSDIKSINPFRSLGSGLSPLEIAGWTSALNPAARSILEYLNIDTLTASMRYHASQVNPVTGQTVDSHPDFLNSVLSQYIPQSQIMSDWMGVHQFLQSVKKTYGDDAYRKRLFGILGIPFVPFSVNTRAERIKVEDQYFRAAQRDVSEAFYRGDTSTLDRYGIVPYHGGYTTSDIIGRILAQAQQKYPSVPSPRAINPTTGMPR